MRCCAAPRLRMLPTCSSFGHHVHASSDTLIGMSITTRSSCSSLGDGGDGSEQDRETYLDEGFMSDRNFVFDKQNQSAESWTDSEPDLDEDKRQGRRERKHHQHEDQHQHQHQRHSGKHAYTSACTRLGIPPSSHVLCRLSSDRLSVRHALLNPASATALSAGLSANCCIRSLNLGSNLLGDDTTRPLLEAISGKPSLTKLDLSRNLLSDRFGALLARSLSSPLCALQELVLAENFLSDAFTDALSKGFLRLVVVKSRIPLRTLDVSNNKISNREKEALASTLRSCSCLVSLNLSWNDLRNEPRNGHQKGRGRKRDCFPFATAALSCPGRLISLELSFNGLADDFGVAIGGMLRENTSLLVLDLSRNHLGKCAAFSIAGGLERNRSLTTLKLGWNNLGREGTLRVIKAIGDNRGPLQIVRLENTTDAGMESEAAREAGVAVARRPRWIEVVCEFPDRARTKSNSNGGPVSWMNEQAPEIDANTTYRTRTEKEREIAIENLAKVVEALKARLAAATSSTGTRTPASGRTAAVVPRSSGARAATASSASSEAARRRRRSTTVNGSDETQDRPTSPGPAKEAVVVPVLSVRLALLAREEARLQAERLTVEEAVAAAENAKKQLSGMLSYLKPLNKTVKEKTLAEPPPRSQLLAKARAGTYQTAVLRERAERKRSPRRGRSVARKAAMRVAPAGKDRRAHEYTSTSRSRSAWGPVRGLSSHGTGRHLRTKSVQTAPGPAFKSGSTDPWARVKSTGQSVWQGSGESKRKVAASSRTQGQLGRSGRSRTPRKARSGSPSGRSVRASTSRGDRRKIN